MGPNLYFLIIFLVHFLWTPGEANGGPEVSDPPSPQMLVLGVLGGDTAER